MMNLKPHPTLLKLLLLLAIAGLGLPALPAQDSVLDQFEAEDPCSIGIYSSVKQFQPGVPFQVGVLIKPLPGWHGYWHSSRDGGDAPDVIWSLPEGWKVSEADFPVPKRMVEEGDLISIGYSKPFLLRFILTPSSRSNVDDPRKICIPVKVIWQVCEKVCIYGKSQTELSISRGDESITMDTGGSSILARWRDRYPVPAEKARGFHFEQQWIPEQGSTPIRKGTWVVRWSRQGDDRRPAVPLQWIAFPHGIEEGLISEAKVERWNRESSVENGRPVGWQVRFQLQELGLGFHPGLLSVTLVPSPGKAAGPVPGMPAVTLDGPQKKQPK
jgi:DsbC/DsbD-like thiol-disulfide interchange protein